MLKGKNLILRPVERKDLDTLRYWRTSPEVSRHYQDRLQISQVEQEAWFEAVSQSTRDYYFVVEKDGEFLGVCNVADISWVHRTAKMGIYFIPRQEANSFLPVEAAILLLDYAFYCLNLRKICGAALATNQRSITFHNGLGFVNEGVLKQHVFHQGRYQDIVQQALFRQDYEKATKDYRQVVLPSDSEEPASQD